MAEGQTKRGAELEEVRQILVECGEMFRNVNDLGVINEGTEYTMKVAAARTAQSEAIRNDLRALSRTLESTKKAAERPAEVPTREQHSRHLESLEQKQYDGVKSIRDLQSELDKKTQKVATVKDDTATWEMKDPVAEHEINNLPLRAQIWKSLGFEMRRGRDGSDKILIRTANGDLRLEPVPQTPTVSETNELWGINSS